MQLLQRCMQAVEDHNYLHSIPTAKSHPCHSYRATHASIGKASWLQRSAGALGRLGRGFALSGAVAGAAFLLASSSKH